MAKNKRATLLSADDWEGLYIDGQLVAEGHKVLQGDVFYVVEVAEKYSLKREDFQSKYLKKSDIELVESNGSMPPLLADFENDY